MDRFKIKLHSGGPVTKPEIIIADAGFDTQKKIRGYNRKRGIKSVIAINPRNKKKNRIGQPNKFDREFFEKRSSIERLFSQKEAYKKIYSRYESEKALISSKFMGRKLIGFVLAPNANKLDHLRKSQALKEPQSSFESAKPKPNSASYRYQIEHRKPDDSQN